MIALEHAAGTPVMPTLVIPRIARDPRIIQIVAQTTLLLLVTVWLDFGPSIPQVATLIGAALACEAARAGWRGEALNWKSALSSALSLSLLLRAANPLLWIAAAALAIGSKSLIRTGGKHLFNPSAFAIVALLPTTGQVWVSPGQWGTAIWLIAIVGTLGALVLTRVARLDIAIAFLTGFLTLLLCRAWYLGDPWAIPLHQMQSGGLLIFALFMLTDPRSTPDSRTGRLIFATAIAVVAHALLFRWQIREGVLYALVAVSCFTPVLDRLFPGQSFAWPRHGGV